MQRIEKKMSRESISWNI